MAKKGSGVEVRDSSIRIAFRLDGKTIRQTLVTNGQPMAPSVPNVRFAERLAAQIRDRIRLGTFSMAEFFPDAAGSTGEAITLERQLETWLSAQRIEESTRAGYRSATRFWASASVDGLALGRRALRAIRHSDLLRALATKPDLSGKTVNNYVSVAREALALAVADGIIQTNPAERIPRAAHQREEPDPFSRDEAELIIADMRSHYPEPVANYVEWRFYSGVRTSEAAGLRWANVDLVADSFRVTEAIVRGVAKTRTKTCVVRDVRLNDQSRAALQRQAKHTRLTGGHVWRDPRYDAPWYEERAFRRSYWEPTIKRLGLRYRPPNHMRHTYATILLMSGRKPAWCAKQMGHSIEMFLRTYSKWISGAEDDREVEGLQAYLDRSGPAAEFSPGFPRPAEK